MLTINSAGRVRQCLASGIAVAVVFATVADPGKKIGWANVRRGAPAENFS